MKDAFSERATGADGTPTISMSRFAAPEERPPEIPHRRWHEHRHDGPCGRTTFATTVGSTKRGRDPSGSRVVTNFVPSRIGRLTAHEEPNACGDAQVKRAGRFGEPRSVVALSRSDATYV